MTVDLRDLGLVRIHQTDDGAVGQIINWAKHQKIDRPSSSHLAKVLGASRESLASLPRERSEPLGRFVYALLRARDGAVKIGCSNDPARRMVEVAYADGSSVSFLGCADGGIPMEHDAHKRFAAHRLTGEWFNPHSEVMEWVQRVLTTPLPDANIASDSRGTRAQESLSLESRSNSNNLTAADAAREVAPPIPDERTPERRESDQKASDFSTCMGALRKYAYLGSTPTRHDGKIVREWLGKGRDPAQVVTALEGFRLAIERGEVSWIPRAGKFTCRALINTRNGDLSTWETAVKAAFLSDSAPRQRGGLERLTVTPPEKVA